MNVQFGEDQIAGNQNADRAAFERIPKVLGPGDIVAILARSWWVIALCMLLAVVSAAALTIIKGPTYSAQAHMLVKIGRERFAAIEVAPMDRPNVVFQDRPEGINNEVEILRDPSLTVAVFPALQSELEAMRAAAHQALLDAPPSLSRSARLFLRDARLQMRDVTDLIKDPLERIGLLHPISEDAALMLRFHNSFNVRAVKQTDILTASFEWDNPQFAAFALRQYMDAYQRRHVAVHSEPEAVDLYRDQVAEARREAEAAERALTSFRQTTGLMSPDTQRNAAVEEFLRLRREHAGLLIEIEDLDLRRAQILAEAQNPERWSSTPESLAKPAIVTIDERAVDLLVRVDALAERITPDAPDLRRALAELERLRERKFALMLQQIGDDRASIQARADLLDARISEQRVALDMLATQEVQHQSLSESLALRRDILREYERLIERLRIGELLDRLSITSIHPISDVIAPLRPSGPRTILVLAVAAVVGLMIGMLLALFRGLADKRLRTPEDVAQGLGVPVVASIPKLK